MKELKLKNLACHAGYPTVNLCTVGPSFKLLGMPNNLIEGEYDAYKFSYVELIEPLIEQYKKYSEKFNKDDLAKIYCPHDTSFVHYMVPMDSLIMFARYIVAQPDEICSILLNSSYSSVLINGIVASKTVSMVMTTPLVNNLPSELFYTTNRDCVFEYKRAVKFPQWYYLFRRLGQINVCMDSATLDTSSITCVSKFMDNYDYDYCKMTEFFSYLKNDTAKDQHEGCECQRCGNFYKIDVSITNELWNEIHPDNNGGGLLCGSCIMALLENKINDYAHFELVRK